MNDYQVIAKKEGRFKIIEIKGIRAQRRKREPLAQREDGWGPFSES